MISSTYVFKNAIRTSVVLLLGSAFAFAQTASNDASASESAAIDSYKDTHNQQDKRIFGVLPNYRTADGSLPFEPITAKQKFTIAAKDSFDWPVYLVSGAFASLYQLEDQNPSFGQGLKGYAKRFGGSYADQALGNVMAEAVIPVLFREDPRYFRHPSGSAGQRLRYAATRVFIDRSDGGRWRFNYSEWVGNSAAVAISNAYYPDTRTVSDNVEKLLVQVATDSFSNVLKEFWPDLKGKLSRRKHS